MPSPCIIAPTTSISTGADGIYDSAVRAHDGDGTSDFAIQINGLYTISTVNGVDFDL